MALNRIPESLVRKIAPVQKVTIVDYCNGNLVQVESLVNRTVDLLAVNVGRPVDSQVAPPVILQGVLIVGPVNRALTVGQFPLAFPRQLPPTFPRVRRQRRAVSLSDIRSRSRHICHLSITASDNIPSTGIFPNGYWLTRSVFPLSWAAPWRSCVESKRFLQTSS